MKFIEVKPLSLVIFISDLLGLIFFVTGMTMAWNYLYRDNTEFRLNIFGYIKTEQGHSKIKSYKDFDNFAELAALVVVSHLIYFIAGIFICLYDFRRIYPSTIGHLRRTNFIICLFFILYSLYQIGILLAWIFRVNKIEKDDIRYFMDNTMHNPKMGFWFSLSATICQLFATVVRLLMTILIKN
ncbi:hypothetical protein EDI_237450 [Entamoeba dispar SAW760]|uniref:Uncharacterized protein n=1 Tax=Entamoeba dispar (strain ATCC PRA-260 / SAW760) TaxID=370354 RepID=B0EP87_ENTDS|nr:uncharacterized protein EDI_237450 [Entamoeba dispar SAW760]EDR23658.1 hypothetical protein EDI_237450 [Entamoeba dispar SAW760]|eukprot:EDR23658.1 hypothetical protein EDI_237450 [Entamoeba dispar SAW760]